MTGSGTDERFKAMARSLPDRCGHLGCVRPRGHKPRHMDEDGRHFELTARRDPASDDDLEYECVCLHGVGTHIDHGPCEGIGSGGPCPCRAFIAARVRDNSLLGVTVETLPYEDHSVSSGVGR